MFIGLYRLHANNDFICNVYALGSPEKLPIAIRKPEMEFSPLSFLLELHRSFVWSSHWPPLSHSNSCSRHTLYVADNTLGRQRFDGERERKAAPTKGLLSSMEIGNQTILLCEWWDDVYCMWTATAANVLDQRYKHHFVDHSHTQSFSFLCQITSLCISFGWALAIVFQICYIG